MSRQLTVRLADDLVEFIDGRVKEGAARSRAAVVARAIERERRHAIAERDVAILARRERDGDGLGGLAEYASRTELTDLA
jgi:Arc/MetJ-type ribon-helix-helix transcriptional regulator